MTAHEVHDMHANSLAAYHSLEDLTRRQREVLGCFSLRDNLTDREVAEMLGREKYTVSPRITELTGVGVLTEAGSTTDRVTGKTVRISRMRQP